VLLYIALVMFATERQASANADPGTGALLWQMLAASLIGVAFSYRRITGWYKNRKAPRL
jgi:hypothetical protein